MITKDLGMVTAYAYAVSKGYTGTEAEFAELMASYATVAQEAVNAALAAAQSAQNAQDAKTAAEGARDTAQTTVSGAIAGIQAEGQTQIGAVQAEGTTQVGNVNTAGTTQVGNVNAAGTTQVGNVNTAGSTQVGAVQAKGEEVLNSIPADYTALSGDVTDLKSAINSMEPEVEQLREDVDALNEGGLVLKDEVIRDQIDNWLDDHPEATTTVEDGAITWEKLNDDVQGNITEFDKYISDNRPIFTKEKSKMVTFVDDSPSIDRLLVHFSPFQDGSGTPSAENVRQIIGYTGTKLTIASGIKFLLTAENVSSNNGASVRNIPGGVRVQSTVQNSYRQCEWRFDISSFIGQSLNLSGTKANTGSGAKRVYSVIKNAQGTSIQTVSSGNTADSMSIDFTVPEGAKTLVVNMYATDNVVYSEGVYVDYYDTCISLASSVKKSISISWPASVGTVYGGYYDIVNGILVSEWGCIDSYDGETLPGEWLSSKDAYAPDATPTTGAQVVYELASPVQYKIGPVEVNVLSGENNIWASIGNVSLTYSRKQKISVVTPEMFGAKGDGITDDSESMTLAVSSGDIINLSPGKTYIITNVSFPHGVVINGNGAILKRPNLKESPYSRTDTQIRGERLIVFSSVNLGQQSIFRDVTFDGNAFTMWQPSDGSKYEQAPLIFVSGSSTTKAQIYLDNCYFKDNYASGVSVSNYTNVKMLNCRVSNCYKTALTCVGYGCDYVIENLKHQNTDSSYRYGPVHIEINSSSFTTDPQSNFRLSGLDASCGALFDAMTGKGKITLENIRLTDIGTSEDNGSPVVVIDCLDGVTCISNSVFVFGDESTSCIKFRPSGEFELNVTDTIFDGTEAPDSFVTLGQSAGATGTVRFTNCTFKGMKYGLWISNQNNNINIVFDKCKFLNITGQAVGSGNVAILYAGSITFTNCIFALGQNCYIYKQDGAGNNQPVLRFSGNKIVGENAGIRIYGLDADTVIFDNELWDAGNTLEYYRSSRNPKVFGMRYRILDEAPSGLAFNDHDTAIVIDPDNGTRTKYLYTGNTWVLQT